MSSSEPLSDALAETLDVFASGRESRAPLTTSEVADSLDCTRRVAADRLERLVEQGRLETKEVGGRERVWWLAEASVDVGRDEGLRTVGDSERMLARLIENVPGMIYRCRNEPEWPMEFASAGSRELTGYAPDALEGDEVRWGDDVIVEDDREEVWEAFQAALSDPNPFSMTYRIRTADGDLRWVRDYARGIFDDDGDVVAVEGIIYDVTERKRLETELDEVFGRVTDAFYALDDQWRFTHANERAEELIDYRGEGLVGKNFWEVFEWATDSTLGEEYRTAMETQEPTSFEFYYPEPLEAWYEVHAYPSETGLSVYFRDVTERVERERELERSERRYRALVENFPNGAVALVDENLHYRTVGGNPDDVADVTAEEVEGNPVREAIPKPLADELVPRYEAALEGESDSFEAEYDDSVFEFQVVPVRDDDGDVFSALGMSWDITERKELEDELRATKERYQRLVEQNLLGIYLVQDGEIQYVNPRFAEIFGYTPEEMLSETEPLDHVAPEDRDTVAENLRARQDGETDSVHYTFTGVRKDGKRIELEVHGSQVEHQGDPAVLGTLLDVTERKRMEAELRRERNLKDQIVETSPVGIAVVGADGTIQFANDRAEEIYGRSREELDEFSHDDPRWDLVDENGDSLETGEAPFDRVLAREEAIYDQVIGLRRPSGERVWVSVNGAPQWNGTGELERAVFAFEDVTERRETQQQLEESERRYRTLAENFPNGAVALFDEDLQYTVTGGTIFEDLGISTEEIVGQTVWERYPEELAAKLEPKFRAALDGETNSFELDFHDRHWLAYTVPVRDDDGDVFAGMLMVQDITEQKERERELDETITELQESEERLQLALKAGEMGTWELDLETGDAPARSPQHDQIFGYEEPLDDWSLEAFLDHVHPDDRERVERCFEEAFETGKWNFECRITGADGERRVISVQGEFYYDDEGEPVRAVGVVQDVTERTEYEQKIQESERRYRALAENFPNGGVGVYDRDLRYTLVTGTMWDDIEPDAADLEGNTIWEALPPDTAEDVEPLFRAALDGETGSVVSTLGGRTYRVWATPLRDADGEITAGQSFALDITDRIEREQKLEETVEKLEESNERLERFASMLAHELRNPVTIGQIYSQQLPAGPDSGPDGSNSEAVEYVTEAFDRIEDMIDVMLVLTRGREAIGDSNPLSLADVTRDAWEEIDAPDATLEVEAETVMQADETYVRHMFRNLFENAVEHGLTSDRPSDDDAVQHGGADVTVRVGELPTGFYVADDGCGIPADERDVVFEAGYTTAGDEGGTGLGLAFVEELADVYGWDCDVTESEAGGARFEFRNVDSVTAE